MNIKNVKTRQWIYGIMICAAPVVVGYGFATVEQAGLWVALGGAILGLTNGLAIANTPDGKHEV